MKTSLRISDVLSEVAHDDYGKVDYTTDSGNLYMQNNGGIAFHDTHRVKSESNVRDISFGFTNWAGGQLFNRLGMPATYFQQMIVLDPKMVAQHFNFWAVKENKAVLLRSKVNGDAGVIRGIVSDQYSRLDNGLALNTLAAICEGKEDEMEIETFHLDDKRMHLRMTFPELQAKAGLTAGGNPDVLRVGLDVINSEVGASSMNVAAMVFRLICSNGLKAWRQDGDAFQQRHIHLKENEFLARMGEAMTEGLKTGAGLLGQYLLTKEIPIRNPFDAIRSIAKNHNFSNGLTDKMISHFEGDYSAYGVTNSITRAARDLDNERRLEVEKVAGKVIKMKPHEWQVIDVDENNVQ